jgi:hypothetical protein
VNPEDEMLDAAEAYHRAGHQMTHMVVSHTFLARMSIAFRLGGHVGSLPAKERSRLKRARAIIRRNPRSAAVDRAVSEWASRQVHSTLTIQL